MKRLICWAIVVLVESCLYSTPSAAETLSFLDNGVIRIGVDLDVGGSITYLARAGGKGSNVINSHDLGRQIQQSYYGGPTPYGKSHPSWPNWSWNPIGSGDVYGNASRVIEHRNDGKELYVCTIPMQWALENVPGECTFETWITLTGNAAETRYRLTNKRADKKFYPAANQELPAVYSVGTLYRLVTYMGDRPNEGQPIKRVENAGPPWADWTATECWAALVDDEDWGLGVIHPGLYTFIGGFHGPPNQGGPKDNSTGYIAPVRREILDHNIVYDYSCIFVLGTVQEIRVQAAARRVDPRPDSQFTKDREHWVYRDARDQGFPIEGMLKVVPAGERPSLIGPDGWWEAARVPRVYLRASFRGETHPARLFWKTAEADFSAERSVVFDLEGGGVPRTYELHLDASPTYRGIITGLRLDPFVRGDADQEFALEFLSWKPEGESGDDQAEKP